MREDSQEAANAVQEIGACEAVEDWITEEWILAGCEGCNWYEGIILVGLKLSWLVLLVGVILHNQLNKFWGYFQETW